MTVHVYLRICYKEGREDTLLLVVMDCLCVCSKEGREDTLLLVIVVWSVFL